MATSFCQVAGLFFFGFNPSEQQITIRDQTFCWELVLVKSLASSKLRSNMLSSVVLGTQSLVQNLQINLYKSIYICMYIYIGRSTNSTVCLLGLFEHGTA